MLFQPSLPADAWSLSPGTGIDLSCTSLSVAEFAGSAKLARQQLDLRVLLADVEGQGDREVSYDARLASSILPISKCVLFNWKDSLQVGQSSGKACVHVFVLPCLKHAYN